MRISRILDGPSKMTGAHQKRRRLSYSVKARIRKTKGTKCNISIKQSPQLSPEDDALLNPEIENLVPATESRGSLANPLKRLSSEAIEVGKAIKILLERGDVKPSHPNDRSNKLEPDSPEGNDGELDFLDGNDEGLVCGRFTPDINEPQFSLADILAIDEEDHKLTTSTTVSTSREESTNLKPCLKICEEHPSSYGCENKHLCDKLHICKQYILDKCQKTGCALGHKWDTDHNLGIIKKYITGPFPSTQLLKSLIVCETSHELGLCEHYNGDGCFSDSCSSLHVCKAFFSTLVGDLESECSGSCKLSHDILNSSCVKTLSLHKIPTNETPRDIALYLISKNPLLCQKHKGNRKKCSSSDSEIESKKKSPTVWSHYYKGDVEISEICYKSVESICPFEEDGCKRLHSNNHFHWQLSKEGIRWFNLSIKQVKCIERAYCDPSIDNVIIPRLDLATLEHPLKDLFYIMGRDSWSVDFNDMKITNSEATRVMQLRRLCTEEVTDVKLKPSTYSFYFLDQDNKWVLYGKTDTLGNHSLAMNIHSSIIETFYISNPTGVLPFANSKYSYTLDFSNMIQKNEQTGKCRKIKRRPEAHLEEEEIEDLPESWKMKERVYRVVLPQTSADFKKVFALLNKRSPFLCSWIRIERIQNIHLWRAYQNKVKEMTKAYGSAAAVNVQHLFHGTTPQNVDRICEENFDWRLNGSNHGRAFGCGSYFSNISQLAARYSKADQIGHHHLFVAQVAVGTITPGHMSMVKPPMNQKLNLPYDSTVNDINNPTIIVKYDKQEYYPEYIITFA